MFKTAKTAKPCNVISSVWAAIIGCTGSGKSYRYAPVSFGRQAAEYACPVCRAHLEACAKMTASERTAHLRALSSAAGVEDYRVAEVVVRDGRPVLTGRISRELAGESARDELHRYDSPRDAHLPAKALRVYAAAGGDCRPLVEAAKLPPPLLRALRAAYRAA